MANELVKSNVVEADRLIALTELDHNSDDERHARLVQEWLGIEQICCDMRSIWSLDSDQARPAMGSSRRRFRGELLRKESVRINLTGLAGDLIMGNEQDDSGQIADYIRHGQVWKFIGGAYSWSRALRIPIYQVFWRGVVPLLSPARQMAAWKRQELGESNPYLHVGEYASCLSERALSRKGEEPGGNPEGFCWPEASPGIRRFLAQLDFHRLGRNLETPEEQEPVRSAHPYMHRPLVEYVVAIPREQVCAPGKRRHLMRRSFERLLPPEVANRKTKALQGHQQYVEGQDLVRRLSKDAAAWAVVNRGWVDQKALQVTLERISNATLREWSEVTRILTLELWLESRRTADLTQWVLQAKL
jgi:asparagine synthase (glutamine-hydrolysing)